MVADFHLDKVEVGIGNHDKAEVYTEQEEHGLEGD